MFPETLIDLEHRTTPTNQPEARGANKHAAKGQSLVELALSLPLLLFLVLGIAEVGNVIRIQVALEAAAREGARAGAVGAPDFQGTRTVASTASGVLAESVEVNEQNTQVWIMRPIISGASAGSYTIDASTNNWTCGYGEASSLTGVGPHGCTVNGSSSMPGDSGISDADLLAQVNDTTLDTTPVSFDDGSGTRFVVVVVFYQAQTLTNTSLFNILNAEVPLRSYTVLRQEVSPDAIDRLVNECPVFPITLIEPNFIAAQVGSNGSTGTGEILQGFVTPTDPLAIAGTPSTREFAFLAWDTSLRNEASLTTSLTPPGNSVSQYVDPTDSTDQLLQISDTVYAYNNNVVPAGIVYDQLETLAAENRQLRVVISGDTGGGGTFDVSSFGIVKIESVTTISGIRTEEVNFEFLRYETGCGVEDTGS